MNQTPPIARAQALVNQCLQALEALMQDGHADPDPEDWAAVFGAKESVVSVLAKLVNMQKILLELEARHAAGESEGDDLCAPMSEEDWALLELCVQRWKERDE